MKDPKRLRALTLASAVACLAVAAAGAQKSQGGGGARGNGGDRLYPVLVNRKWGYVDRSGKLVIADGEPAFIDREGNVLWRRHVR